MNESAQHERPGFPVERIVGPELVWPVPKARKPKNLQPGPWMPGTDKPVRDGKYLRFFDDVDDCAFSWFGGGKWLRDGFWESDVQDAPWRGGVRPNAGAKPGARRRSI